MTENQDNDASEIYVRRSIRIFILENSLLLVAGAAIALVWANISFDSYHGFVETDLWHNAPGFETAATGSGDVEPSAQHGLTLHYLITDFLMALFFAIAAKEVWEAILPGGPLSSPRKAATPLLATLGGMAGPAGLFLLGAWLLGRHDLYRGWAVPCATDIAFSYLVARFVFRDGHPAIAFLLLLAIADDAGGLIILAVAYPQKTLAPEWFLLTGAAIAMCLLFQKLRLHSFWWYLLMPGTMSWISFHMSGIHAALGLVPIIPFIPHAHTDLGIFAREELDRHDTLNEFEHFFKYPVELILGLFALVNAGVAFGNVGGGTILVLLGLLIGKTVGITLFTFVGQKILGLQLPPGMRYKHVISVGMIAAIGFTVALFVAAAAFPPGEIQDEIKMGALASLSAAILAFVGARLLGVRRDEPLHAEPAADTASSSG